jgi:osmotically-inducible protein OsmY
MTRTPLTAPLFAATALLVVPALSGCVAAVVAGGAAVGIAAAQDRSMGAAFDDTATYSAIKGRLLSRGVREFGEVDVQVVRGFVLLSGRVTTEEEKATAEHIARHTEGAREVANELLVQRPGGVLNNLNDEWITKSVQAQHIASPHVRAVNIVVETYNGVVYLLGTARTEDELRHAAEIASRTSGVQRVVSYVELIGHELGPATTVQTGPAQ